MNETMSGEEFRRLPCPVCGNLTHIKVYHNTVLLKFPLFCSKCKKETIIDVVQLKMIASPESDR